MFLNYALMIHQDYDITSSLRRGALHLLNAVSTPISTVGPSRALNNGNPSYPDDPSMPHLEDIYASPSEGLFTDSSYDDEGVVTDFNNLETIVNVSPTPITRIHTIQPKTQILRDPMSTVQIRSKVNKNSEAHALSAFLYGTIDEEVYVTQPPSFVDTKFPNKVYKVVKALYGLHQALRACVKTASTPIETQKPLVKDEEAADVDVHLYRFQVTPKTSHLQAVKRIFRYLKGHLKLGLWYPKVSSFDLEAYSDSDYAEAEYVAAAYCCEQVLWIQNQLLDYRFNIMNTKIYIDNESTICILKNHVFHSKTKHIEIRHHFIKDAYEKKLIQVLKIHTDDNVADLLTKAFDVSSKELASPKQTALGKDNLNPLIVDSLLKTIWLSMHHVIAMKQWLFQSKRLLIVDFLNTQVIQYALIVNPTIYVSCIKQFWAMTSIKKANDVVKLQALIDEKRVVVSEDVIREDLRLDDVDGVECLPNKEIFTELARMGYEKPPPSRKFDFSKYIFDSMVRNVDSPNKFLMYPQSLQVIIKAQVDDLSSHTNQYTSPALTQKEHITTPSQAQPASPSSPPQEQPTDTSKSYMTLLNTLMKTCATLSQKVAQLEQDKIAQALEIFKLKRRVMKLEKKRRSNSSGLKRLRQVDADEDITLLDMETQVDLSAELQGRKDDDNVATKDASVVEPTVFDDEEVTMTMAQTLIKMKAKKARILDEQMAKRLHDEEVEQAAAREKQEKDDLEKAKVKYQSLKRKPVSIAQARKNMIIYLKNMAGYKMEHFKCMTYDKESFKKLKAIEVSGSHSTQDTPTHDPKEMFEEDVKNMLEIIPVSKFKVEALQVKEELSLVKWSHDPDADQKTIEQKFGYVLQVIKKLGLKKLDGLLAEVDDVQRLKEKALRD
nr:hypothetical protein [Tanacetum cinerariifolium]